MAGQGKDGGGKVGFGVRLGRSDKIVEFPHARMERRQREFCEAVARLKAALSEEKSLPVSTRQALVAGLGVFDNWPEEGGSLLPHAGLGREIARQILLLDYRLSVLKPLAGKVNRSLCHAVRQYAEASELLLEAVGRRAPDGEWLDRPRRTELEALVLMLCGKERDGG